MAIACLEERTPCLPSRTCSISSRTNSPACVLGDLPSRASSRARSRVFFSGMETSCECDRCNFDSDESEFPERAAARVNPYQPLRKNRTHAILAAEPVFQSGLEVIPCPRKSDQFQKVTEPSRRTSW